MTICINNGQSQSLYSVLPLYMMSKYSSHDTSKPHGCFSSLLHRFLCSGGLPTHPSSDIDSPKNPPSSTTNPNPSSTSTSTPVGIVARLMGLDSIPHYSVPVMQKSRSLGSLDLFHISNHHVIHHRRAVSFREHDLIANPNMGLTPVQDKSKSSSDLRAERGTNMTKEREQVPLKTRRKRVVAVDDGFPDAKNKCKSRVKSRCNHTLPKPKPKPKTKPKTKTGKYEKMRVKRRETDQDYCIKVLKQVCRLTMIELQGGVWVNNNNNNNNNINNIQAEISYEIGQQILQLLVHEIVDDLYVTNLSSLLNTVSYINC